jgi:isoamylase
MLKMNRADAATPTPVKAAADKKRGDRPSKKA